MKTFFIVHFRLVVNAIAFLPAVLAACNPFECHASSIYAQTILADNPIGYWRLDEVTGSLAADSSSHGLGGTYNGGVILNRPSAIASDPDASVTLNGNSGYISVPSDARLNQLTNNFTIEAWVRPSSPAPGNADPMPAYRVVSTRSFQVSPQSGYGLSFETSDNTLWFTAFAVKDYQSGVSVPYDVWSDVAVTLDSSNTARFYVNGVLKSTVLGSAPVIPNSSSFDIGREPIESSPGVQSYFNGGLDEVAIYNGTLSESDLRNHYLAALPEPAGFTLGFIGAIGLLACALRSRMTFWRLR